MKFDLRLLRPSRELLDFYDKYDSFEDAWNACPRGDWMLWIAARLEIDFRTLTLAKSRCARTVIDLMKDKRSINAVEVSEQYGLGTATKEELHKAYKEAVAASYAAPAAAASYAAYAASAAASYASSAAAFSAPYDASASAVADFSATAAIAKLNNQQQTADICREILTEEVFKKLKQTL
jgi:hypothetical protein